MAAPEASKPWNPLLRAFPQDDIQLGDQAASTNMGAVLRGTIRGQPAVIKLLDLASVEAALEAAAEVRTSKTLRQLHRIGNNAIVV